MVEVVQGKLRAYRFICPAKATLQGSLYLGYCLPDARTTFKSMGITWLSLFISLIAVTKGRPAIPVLYIVVIVQLIHGAWKISCLRKTVFRNATESIEVRPIIARMLREHQIYWVSIYSMFGFLSKLDIDHSNMWDALAITSIVLGIVAWTIDKFNRSKWGVLACMHHE